MMLDGYMGSFAIPHFAIASPSAAPRPGNSRVYTLTRSQPADWTGYCRRIDGAMLQDVLDQLGRQPHSYVCGPTPLVEAVSDDLVSLGVPPEVIQTERFGPCGS